MSQIQFAEQSEKIFKTSLNNRIMLEIDHINELRARHYTKGDHFKFETMDFNWLLERMTGQPDNKYYGCELNVTETVLFKDGRPNKIIRTESNRFVTTIKNSISL